ncbi:MAG: ATP-binding protein, partial [Salinibacter sp.]
MTDDRILTTHIGSLPRAPDLLELLKRRQDELRRLVNERTERLAREKEKTEAQAERLAELDAEKNRFFANVSHELRTPLTLILGPLRDLLEGTHGPVPDAVRAQLRRMLRNAERLRTLIDQLLDLSTLETEGLELSPVRADLVPFLRSLVQAFVPLAEREKLTLQFRPHVEAQALDFDPDKLEKAVSNLLANAVKFTPEDGTVLVVVDAHDGDAPAATVVVHDTGPGIPESEQSRLFERFHQGDDAESKGGTGIGLTLAAEIAELHGGAIDVTSVEGEGSTFTVRLPLPDDVAPGDAPAAPATEAAAAEPGDPLLSSTGPAAGADGPTPPAPDDEPPADAPLILIVEDNAGVRAHLRRHLMDSWAVVEAADGAAGLDAARTHEPDLVLLDVMLPERDGVEVCRALRDDPGLEGVPVIMLTARAGETDTARGLEAGADAYLTKPFSVTELRAYIDRLLDARAALREQFTSSPLVPSPDATSADDALLERVVDAIEAHLGRGSFTVDDLAAEVGFSPRQLRRRLKDLTDMAPSEVVRTYRLRYAAALLEAEAGTVSEVAFRVGFGTVETFSKRFKEHFGCVPSAYPPASGSSGDARAPDALSPPSVSGEDASP